MLFLGTVILLVREGQHAVKKAIPVDELMFEHQCQVAEPDNQNCIGREVMGRLRNPGQGLIDRDHVGQREAPEEQNAIAARHDKDEA